MKIIKVIVDEMPKACINCGYGHLKDSPYCTLNQCRGIDINPYERRPDWCPLEVKGHESKWSMVIETRGMSEFITVKNEQESEEE